MDNHFARKQHRTSQIFLGKEMILQNLHIPAPEFLHLHQCFQDPPR